MSQILTCIGGSLRYGGRRLSSTLGSRSLTGHSSPGGGRSSAANQCRHDAHTEGKTQSSHYSSKNGARHVTGNAAARVSGRWVRYGSVVGNSSSIKWHIVLRSQRGVDAAGIDIIPHVVQLKMTWAWHPSSGDHCTASLPPSIRSVRRSGRAACCRQAATRHWPRHDLSDHPRPRQPGGKSPGVFAGFFRGGTECGTVICVTAAASVAGHVAPQYEWGGSCGGSTQQSRELRWRSE